MCDSFFASSRALQNFDLSPPSLEITFLRAGIADTETGLWFPSDKGVPQGGPLLPLSSNVLLDELDKKLTRERLHFARYADDIIILVKSQHMGNKVKVAISRYISKRLKLIINETKSRVGPFSDSTFLGFAFPRGLLQIHANSLKLFKEKVRVLTNRNWGIAMKKQIYKLNLFLRGGGNYHLIGNAYQLTVVLDSWIRRRLRMCYFR